MVTSSEEMAGGRSACEGESEGLARKRKTWTVWSHISQHHISWKEGKLNRASVAWWKTKSQKIRVENDPLNWPRKRSLVIFTIIMSLEGVPTPASFSQLWMYHHGISRPWSWVSFPLRKQNLWSHRCQPLRDLDPWVEFTGTGVLLDQDSSNK